MAGLETHPAQAISADPALAAIFMGALNAGYSVHWAFFALLTVLSMKNYYGQQPAFDSIDNVTSAFLEYVLFPRDCTGFTILMWTIVAHFTIMATLIVLFVKRTRLSLLRNAWSAFAQLAESQDVRDYIANAILKTDSEFVENLNSVHSLSQSA